jgi:hypothetical protein
MISRPHLILALKGPDSEAQGGGARDSGIRNPGYRVDLIQGNCLTLCHPSKAKNSHGFHGFLGKSALKHMELFRGSHVHQESYHAKSVESVAAFKAA